MHRLRGENPDLFYLIGGGRRHHPHFHSLAENAVADADQNHHAEVGIVPAVDEQRLQRRADIVPRVAAGG